MTAGTGLVQRWEIVAQRGGEVSATREQAPGLELWLLGVPRGTSEAEVRGWLHDVAGVALEASHGPRGAQPIPTLLHHALTGLLFSHAEVWERPGQPAPCSVVFTGEDDEIGFGWIGAAQVELSIDGHPTPARWVLVRDSTGREAHAFRAPADRDVLMRLTWYPSPLDPDSAMIELEAHWTGGAAETLTERAARLAAEARAILGDPSSHAPVTPSEDSGTAAEVAPMARTPDAGTHAATGPAERSVAEEPDRHAAELPEPAPAPADESSAQEARYEPITGHDEGALDALPPGRPSTGIARWLQKNFGWLGSGHAGAAGGHATLPVPPVAEPPLSAEQIALRLGREAALAGERAATAAESGAEAGAVPASDAPALDVGGAPGDAMSGAAPEPAAASEVARSLEDELAASAAALAAALGGEPAAVDPGVAQDPPWWRGSGDTEAVVPHEPQPGEPAGAETPTPVESTGALESLPDAIPPTPEPPELTRHAIVPPPEPPELTPRTIVPATPEPVRPLPPTTGPPAVPPPVLTRPVAPPPSVTARPPRPASESASGAVTPPRMEVPARLLLRRPREATPDDAHEIHSRALGARDETPASPEPLMIERVGAERPVVIPPRVAPPTPEPAGAESGAGPPSEPRVVPAADASAWVSRFIKRVDPTAPAEPTEVGPQSGDESAWLESARRDEWREFHGGEVAAPSEPPTPPAASASPLGEAAEPERDAPEPEPDVVSGPDAAHESHGEAESPEPWSPPDVEPAAVRPRIAAQRPEWPEASELEAGRRLDRRWLWAVAVVAVLFGVGWLLGAVQWPAQQPGETRRGPLAVLLQTLGFHGPRYQVSLSSRPDGASIKVDGQDLQQRTPATIEVPPGKHVVTLFFGQWGETRYPVDGKKGDHVNVDGTLWGALEMVAPDPGSVVAISIDERPRGFAPLKVDSLAPGPHQVRFSGPGMASWSQTVEVKVGETVPVLTRALSSPSTGLLQIRATSHTDGEVFEARGAKVFLDGHPHGVTPQSVELPRGPHSVRAEWQGVSSAVQMIDLPGGNQRYATFDFSGGAEPPRFKLDAPARFSETEPVVISVTVDGLGAGDVREMWLHIRGPEGTWERYPMSRLDSRTSAVGALTFPVGAFDAQGTTQWYVSIVSGQGDEYFTELQDAQLEKTKR